MVVEHKRTALGDTRPVGERSRIEPEVPPDDHHWFLSMQPPCFTEIEKRISINSALSTSHEVQRGPAPRALGWRTRAPLRHGGAVGRPPPRSSSSMSSPRCSPASVGVAVRIAEDIAKKLPRETTPDRLADVLPTIVASAERSSRTKYHVEYVVKRVGVAIVVVGLVIVIDCALDTNKHCIN